MDLAGAAERAGICVQSMPENSMRSCAALSVTAPSCTGGQVKPPASSRLITRQRPEPSQRSSLTLSVRLARKTNTSPANGSAASTCVTMATRPSMPLRKSTGLDATTTRSPGRDGMPRITVPARSDQAPAAKPPDRPHLPRGPGHVRSRSQSIPQLDPGPMAAVKPARKPRQCSHLPHPQGATGQNAVLSPPPDHLSPGDAMSKASLG